jgi:hypothetical protein
VTRKSANTDSPQPKTLAPNAWLKGRAPTANDRQLEALWLREHWDYGGRIHEETARALVQALSKPSSRQVGHGLFFKLFAEYANALEIAGAWGWVIRTRREGNSLLLDAFLTYPHHAPRIFYSAARRNRSGSLGLLLDLPVESKVVSALHAVFPEWDEKDRRHSMSEAVRQAKFLADRYFDTDEIVRSTYNRAKHGATMLHHPSLTPRQFYVIAPHLAGEGARYDLPKFTVDRRMISSLEHGVRIAGTMIRYFAGLATALNGANCLYPSRRARPSS